MAFIRCRFPVDSARGLGLMSRPAPTVASLLLLPINHRLKDVIDSSFSVGQCDLLPTIVCLLVPMLTKTLMPSTTGDSSQLLCGAAPGCRGSDTLA